MTDKQINAAIAAHLGITRKTGIPDFSGDLNEMHEAEKVLTGKQQGYYWDHLQYIITDDGFEQLHATARQRAEAFLRTLGKWEEAE
jgi:hypothetical protein